MNKESLQYIGHSVSMQKDGSVVIHPNPDCALPSMRINEQLASILMTPKARAEATAHWFLENGDMIVANGPNHLQVSVEQQMAMSKNIEANLDKITNERALELVEALGLSSKKAIEIFPFQELAYAELRGKIDVTIKE